ncbi:endonuclease/exonuclease/phosphatase family protein [Rheinheimera sp. UJ51]|uniref:endonuclease/exonuclease/phosphatase family protein n=1 Tax=Rheinheimera sp. UJ51 TaxID=2892446 RepID=UPI001E36E83D|nr:endonuclease/exonuclease/phosphatase family protein [Rheinheimera sp. UJ51]MCC5452539.1 endonuclease/exonuclease/phosphatase family protein [Rheinheimera sp. UJ51]
MHINVINVFIMAMFTMLPSSLLAQQTLKVATFNVSMEADNYLKKGEKGSPQVLMDVLASKNHPQVKNIAAIIQRVRPDILLLNEFDYIADPEQGVQAFINNYLQQAQAGSKAIDYPYFYYHTVNTGQPSPYDLDNNGKATGVGNDAWGFGFYPGQYGMVLLSKYPIVTEHVRTFQHFKWKDMPQHLPTLQADGKPWYSKEAWQEFPLSSKSHWDVPVLVGGKTVHLLISHPTPPVFDGPENRNGKRNHDEIRFWTDYLSAETSGYIYDDQGQLGGIAQQQPFVILGDLNASAEGEGDALLTGIAGLTSHPSVNNSVVPQSAGGLEHSPDREFAASHTASWRMRADYVLPSKQGFNIKDAGVFWPAKDTADYYLIGTREASSDHRLVWLELELTAN